MHGSDMYQEVILHLAMAGVRRFLWWRNSHELPLTKGIEIANCVVAEADKLIGDSARTPLSLDDTVSLVRRPRRHQTCRKQLLLDAILAFEQHIVLRELTANEWREHM